ncbi:dCTP deaminase [Natranaeroarchaeum sulfidigenes]|uniref:Deoxycytidine deaminase n=1 Tax=Natranaeroarchaeum sulfidigenes TaxID=2784880 RepID=A0A897MSR2_9EURY|nr:dCTP deaminase [Natranaeroarchaeum sulfidigenes]QSG03537.1 Deoxycytidine deaminase [Natranaeroarchaeum sulfidigenes]
MPALSELVDALDGIVHEPTQRHDDRVDLTVREVFEVREPGRVDFGGGELEDAELVPHDRTWRNDDDEYQWWGLDAGQYLIEYNERLDIDERAVLQVRDELRARGVFHPTLHVDTLSMVPLSVAAGGLQLKENARVSTLLADR